VRRELGEISSELLAVRFTGYRTLTALQKGQIPGPEAGLAKVTIVNNAIKAGDLIADVQGPEALADNNEWAYMISFLPGLKAAGGAGLDAFEAMLVLGECGRVLASIPLLGHLPATAILNDSSNAPDLLEPLATGERRAAYLPVSPPNDLDESWSVDPAAGSERAPAPTAADDGGQARVSGKLSFVPDAPGADLFVGVALLDTPQGGTGGKPVGVAIEADAAGLSVE